MLAYAEVPSGRAYEMAAAFRMTAKSATRSAKRLVAKRDMAGRQLLVLSKNLPSTLRGLAQVLEICAERDDWESPVDPEGSVTPRSVWESAKADIYPAAEHASALFQAWDRGSDQPANDYVKSHAAAVLVAWNNLESFGAEIFDAT
ncbi:MAG: hypothetical protein WD942_00200 [Dehalococcoidia bacterium]